MALDQATESFIAEMAKSGRPPLHEMEPAAARALGPQIIALLGPGPQMERVEDVVIEGHDGGSFAARLLVPGPLPRGVVLYFHGGGWVLGGLDESDNLTRTLAQRTGCVVVSVDYRLAPEHRYPTAAEDAWSAVLWVHDHRPDLGVAADAPLIVAGDSAGGTLATVVSRRARDEGGPDIALQVLVYPVTDADLDTGSYLDRANQLMLSRETMIWFWGHYAPDQQDRERPDASPLRVGDLAGLPPATILTAEHDVLRDEGEAYAERLAQAGVDVDLRRFEGQMHGFFTLINVLPGSGAGIDHVVAAIDRRIAAPTGGASAT